MLSRACYNQKALELAEAEAESKDLSARTQWAVGGVLINPLHFYSVWHNHSELKVSWLAHIWAVQGLFWGLLPEKSKFWWGQLNSV